MGLLYKREIEIEEGISVHIPTVGEIIGKEESYYSIVTAMTSTPYDLMVQLDDMGIDFSVITQYELFLMLFENIKNGDTDTSIVFGELDLSKFELTIESKSGGVILRNPEDGLIINQMTYRKISSALREINNLAKNDKTPGNEEAKKYMIERARKKQKAAKRKAVKLSQLERLIVALVNVEQFKYNYETVRDMTIFQFHTSVNQTIKKTEYDNIMLGHYTGNLNANEIDQNLVNWLLS